MQADREAVKKWITFLHGGSARPGDPDYNQNTDTAGGLIHISSQSPTGHHGWRGHIRALIDEAVDQVIRLDAAGELGVYLRTTSLKRIPVDENGQKGGRGGAEDSCMFPGFALDMDIAGAGHAHEVCTEDPCPVKHVHHKRPLPDSDEAVLAIIKATGLPAPTTWVHSGGGMYPWWVLEKPELINPDEAPEAFDRVKRIFAGIEKLVLHSSNQLGYDFGTGVTDLARVLRIPGTVNRKAGLERMCREMPELASYDFFTLETLETRVAELVAALPAPSSPAPVRGTPRTTPSPGVGGLTPGDDYENQNSWDDILTGDGWTFEYERGGEKYWRRPGKTERGHSATTGAANDRDRLFVFSPDAGLPTWEPITKFHHYALTRHNGNHAAAASDLRGQGYGGQSLPSLPTNLAALIPPADNKVVKTVSSEIVEPEQAQAPALKQDSHGLALFSSDDLARHHWDELGTVDLYVDIFHQGLKYVSETEEWMIWDGQRWVRDQLLRHKFAAKKLVQAMVQTGKDISLRDMEKGPAILKAAQKMATMPKVTQLPNMAKSEPKMGAHPKDFDRAKNLLTVDNGILNLDTFELTPHDPARMLTKKVNAKYLPDVTDGRGASFVEEIFPDVEVRDYVQRLAAMTLLGKSDERVIPMLFGGSGSGKTAFLEMLYGVFGDFAAVADESTLKPTPDNYQGPSEKLHSLMGTRFVKMSEISQGSSLNEALVKSITGSDTQKTRPLYGHPVEWQVEYVVWMATNHLPRISSSDEAIWNRVKPIHLPGRFIDAQGRVEKAENRDLGRRLASEEASWVLNWLLEGLKRYREVGLAEPAQVGAWLSDYRDEVDTTRQFMAEAQENGQVKVEESATIPARDLYQIYLAWASEAQVRFPLSINTFKARMVANGYEQVKTKTANAWKGIGVAGWIAKAQTPSGYQYGMGRQRT